MRGLLQVCYQQARQGMRPHQVRKTSLMREVEYRIGMPLEKALPCLLAAQGLATTSRALGVPGSTLSRWALKFKVRWPRRRA